MIICEFYLDDPWVITGMTLDPIVNQQHIRKERMKLKHMVLVVTCLIFSSCSSLFRAIKITPSNKIDNIIFSGQGLTLEHSFYYPDTLNNKYLQDLRQRYKLDVLTSNLSNEIEKISAINQWCSKQWEHNGSNTPSKSDALTILKEAKAGKKFRCVEYGIVASECLKSIGIPARVLGIKTQDVEKVKFGAGHVVAEAYSNDYSKWVFIDPQFNNIPFINGVPLNAVEFQKAIYEKSPNLELYNWDGKVDAKTTKGYIAWIGKYLYYFDVSFDQRIGVNFEKKEFEGKKRLMLVPLRAKNPTIFQRKHKLNSYVYTNSYNDFYLIPNK